MAEPVTSVEPGCTCGGIAACAQCQERDALAADIPPMIWHVCSLGAGLTLTCWVSTERPCQICGTIPS